MGNSRFSLKKSFKFATTEYVHWITDPKMLILAVLIIFIYEFDIKVLVDAAAAMNTQISFLEPFASLGSSGTVMLILPLVYLVLMAGYPRVQAGDWFCVVRMGRINWGVGQLFFGIMTIITYVTFIGLCTIVPVIWRSDINTRWSDVATKYSAMFPELKGNFADRLLPENLYNQMSVGKAVFHTYAYLALYLFLLLLILLVFSLGRKRFLGFVAACLIVGAGTALCSVNTNLMWIFPMAHSVVWLHYTEYFREMVVLLGESYLYFGVLISILIIISMQKISRYQYVAMET